MPLVIPYIRFSTKEQEEGSSLSRQREKVGEWKKANPGYDDPTERYEDLGKSGRGDHIEKGRLGALLEAVEKGMIPPGSVILIEAIDRLTRLEPIEALEPVKKIIGAGVILIDLESNTRYDRESLKTDALMMFLFKARGAYEYSARLGGRIVESYKDRAKEAKEGKRINRRNGFWLTGDGKLTDAVDVVRGVFHLFLNGTPIKQIVRAYPEHLKNTASCRNLLRNPATMGSWQRTTTETGADGKKRRVNTELIDNVFDPAVDAATYFQAQELLNLSSSPEYTTARKFYLAGLFYCVECESKMQLLKAGPNSVTDRLRCSTHVVNPSLCSNGATFPVPVAKFFVSHTSTVFAYKGFKDSRLPEQRRKKIELEGRIDLVKKEITATAKRMDLDPTDLSYEEEFKERVQRRNDLELELASITEAPASADMDIYQLGQAMTSDNTSPLMQEFKDYLYSHDPMSINKMLQLGGYGVWVGEDGFLALKDTTLFRDDAEFWCALRYLGYNRKTKNFRAYYQGKERTIEADGTEINNDNQTTSIVISGSE